MSARLLPLLLLLPVLFGAQPAGAVTVEGLRLWGAPDHTRLVLDMTGRARYKLFRLHRPERVVIDIAHARDRIPAGDLRRRGGVVRAIRSGRRADGALRIVLDLTEKVEPRSAQLRPYHGKPHRLVVDLMRVRAPRPVATGSARPAHGRVVVAVDAGHGGEDPGAIGPHGLREKVVTLAIARAVVERLDRVPGVDAFLVRRGDYFVPLKQRVRIARRHHADMMISIHADSVRDRRVAGASVYTLSERGATPDKVAQALAARENAADAVAGIIAGNPVDDPLVNSILGEMARTDSLNSSLILAEQIIRSIGRVAPVKYRRPKRARFVVLGAMEIPSVLVETDYISNPRRERLLRSRRHQRRLARAIAEGGIAFLRRMGRLEAPHPRRTSAHASALRGGGVTSGDG